MNPFQDSIVSRYRPISTLVDTPRTLEQQYSSPCSVQCWYCHYKFKDRPFPYPEPFLYFPRTRKIMPRGFFCMPHCVMAQIVYVNNGFKQGQQLEWFHQMMRDVYGIRDSSKITPSPPQRYLKNKGGTITKQQLRKVWSVLPSYTIVQQPFICRLTVIKELVRDIEKGESKQTQYDFAKQQIQNQSKEKKKNATFSVSVKKRKHREIIPDGKREKKQCLPNLILDSQVILRQQDQDSKDRRKGFIQQILQTSKVGNQDWWNVNQTFHNYPERKKELVDLIYREMEDEDKSHASHSVSLEEDTNVKREEGLHEAELEEQGDADAEADGDGEGEPEAEAEAEPEAEVEQEPEGDDDEGMIIETSDNEEEEE